MGKLEAIGVEMEYFQPRTGKRLRAIERIDLEVLEGEFVSIVGPSGCGKTTFLKIVDGLIAPTGGELRLDGRRIVAPSRDRALVFQDASLFPWYTVVRNVAYGLECQGIRAADARRRAEPFIHMTGRLRTALPLRVVGRHAAARQPRARPVRRS